VKNKFSHSKNSQKKVSLRNVKVNKKHNLFPRLLIVIFVIVSLSSIYISLASRSAEWIQYSFPDLKVGDISPRREIAPFDFDVPKPEKQLEEERGKAALSMLPVFRLNETIFDEVDSEIDSVFIIIDSLSEKDISDSVGKSLINGISTELTYTQIDTLVKIIKAGKKSLSGNVKKAAKESFENISELLIVPDKSYVTNVTDDYFVLENGDTVSVDMTIEVEAASELLKVAFLDKLGNIVSKNNLTTIQNIFIRFLKPNLIYDNKLTSELRRKASESVPIYSASFKKNERIIDANVPITETQLKALDTLKKEIARISFIENRWRYYAIAIGKTIIGLGIIGVILSFIYLYRLKIYESASQLLLIIIISTIPIIVAFYFEWGGRGSEFLVPVAIASILITILFDAELGIIFSLGISLIVSSFFPSSGIRIGIIYFLSSSIGVFTVGHVRHRKEFYRSMLFIPIMMAVSIAATNDWITHTSISDVGYDVFLGSLNGFFCPIIAIGLLPLLESLFKMTTDITLFELSDLNNPLLKELAVRAPGTYSSVIVVGTLAETAAEKVGANPLLCRVGSYYHDIGKMAIPEYFIENQMSGDNPHNRLSPYMSALVIASHVKEGYELGVKHGLPEAVLDIIQQHHGTSLMESIYHKALDETDNKPVDEMAFRYPGPKPQTREAAIVMLADLVEAASRSVEERSPGRLKALISTIIQKRFMDGELDECDLTLKNLHIITESFLPILVGYHHGRIEYPWQKGESRIRKKSANNHSFHEAASENNKIEKD